MLDETPWRGRLPRSLASAVLAVLLAAANSLEVLAADVRVAVAANFTGPAKEVARIFELASGHRIVLSFGSTGQFYAQIAQGAPFDALFSADKATPAKIVAQGLGDASSVFTYAVGRLVLYSRTEGLVRGEATLRDGTFNKIAIANPQTAPYGAAAIQTMMELGVYDRLASRVAQGTNIGQTFQFVASGNAELGFVALSQIAMSKGGSRWVVPEHLHRPIAQDALLLKSGADNEAAKAFLAFVKGPAARAVIEKFGYGVAR